MKDTSEMTLEEFRKFIWDSITSGTKDENDFIPFSEVFTLSPEELEKL